MGTTDRFGLSTFGPRMPGTSIDDDGGKFSDSDRLLLDRILSLAHWEQPWDAGRIVEVGWTG